VDGISRGFNLKYKETNYADVDIADYATDIASANVNFGIPLNEFDSIRFDFTVAHTDFILGDDASTQVSDFENDYGDSFLDYKASVNWTHDSRDSSLFPTRGGVQRLGAMVAVPGSDLTYYRAEYQHRRYFPITESLTFSLNADIGYGDGYGDVNELPFFENFLSGGTKSVRGFKDFSLGPRDDNDEPIGGNLKVVGNAELLFPPPFDLGEKTVRLGTFIDAGNVYDTTHGDFDFGELRYSAGVSMVWLSPMGVLGISLAAPLNDESGDETEMFQFTFGSTF
jgi:outer membrane protein insertion porin family